ncbi:hypothetical protein ACHAXR_009441 [Thalassiosira sp. AJA248-18]
MRPYKPAPKNASANRIRERYLHQLGLQRGGAPLTAPHLSQSNHVVVISGLPSLPEDRATTTTEHVMEAHDFSISSKVSRHSQYTGGQSVGDDANSYGDMMDDMSDSGRKNNTDAHSHCSKSTLSVSPNTSSREAGETLTSMALAYPTALGVKKPITSSSPSASNNYNNNGNHFAVPWRSNSLSKPAIVLLEESDHHRSGDHDSVSSAGTSTTAESSLTAAHNMLSRDWGTIPHNTTSAGVSVSSTQGGESPASSTPGVYFQCGHPHLLGSHVHVAPTIGTGGTAGLHCPTTSLTHALNRFNIDSDCEASVASNSMVEDHIMMDDDDAESFDDTASRTSVTSHTSAGSTKSQRSSASHNVVVRVGGGGGGSSRMMKKKIGKTQRLMDRAVAHERILQIRSDRSQKMRANLVHSQRMSNTHYNISNNSGLSLAMGAAHEGHHQLSGSPGSASSSQASASSIPLLHVQHGSSQAATAQEKHPLHQSMGDLGRTPTASNCSDLRKLKALGPPCQYLPAGVHISTYYRHGVVPNNNSNLQGGATTDGTTSRKMVAPLGFHPQLASRIPTPPPKVAAATGMMMMMGTNNSNTTEEQGAQAQGGSISKPSLAQVESREAENSTSSSPSLQYMNHHNQATVDDVMEVAMTLSKLGSVRTGSVPRIR